MRWPNGTNSQPTVSSAFGPRSSSVGSRYHRGVDLVGWSTIRAVAKGTVRYVGVVSGWAAGGVQVWIQHDGFFSKSMHMRTGSTRVSVGQHVSEGQVLGTMGQTGNVTGTHLHLEITPGVLHKDNSGQVDPVPYIKARLGQLAGTAGEWSVADKQRFLVTLGLDTGGVDNDYGDKTIKATRQFQKWASIDVDGDFGPNTIAKAKIIQKGGNYVDRPVKDIQVKLKEKGCWSGAYGWKIDGEWGNQTSMGTYLYQSRNGLNADAAWGEKTDAKAFASSSKPNDKDPYLPLDVDGEWGPGTTRALQYNLGLRGEDVDGELGPQTIKLLQESIGADPVDGEIGPDTTSRLQKNVGATIDGELGPDTVKKLQTFLNAEKKFAKVSIEGSGSVLNPARPWEDRLVDSPLATWIGSPNYNYRPSGVKDHITLHWMAGTLAGTDSHFQNPGTVKDGLGTGASTQYGIGLESVHQYVKEDQYAHGDGHAVSNATGISIEHEGGYTRSDGSTAPVELSTLKLSAALCADIAIRHKWGKLELGVNVFPHNHWTATTCPGTLDMEYIVSKANAIILGSEVEPEPADTVTMSIEAYEKLLEAQESLNEAVAEIAAP